MNQKKISQISIGSNPKELIVKWVDRRESVIDLSDLIESLECLRPLDDQEFFKKAKIEAWGWSVGWGEDVSIGADLLWRLALEQAGESMKPADFKKWRVRNRLSQARAAQELGLTKRTIIYYESGEKIIPKTVLLATRGFDGGVSDSFSGSPREQLMHLDKEMVAALHEVLSKRRVEEADARFTSSFVPTTPIYSSNQNVVSLEKHRQSGLERRKVG